MQITFGKLAVTRTGVLVVGVAEGRKLTATAEAVDGRMDGQLKRAIATGAFTGGRGQFLAIPAPTGVSVRRVVAVGLGKPGKLTVRALEVLGGKIYKHLVGTGEKSAAIALDALPEGAPQISNAAVALATGARLASYRFDKYRTTEAEDKKPKLERLSVLCPRPREAANRFEKTDVVLDAVTRTRDLVSEPANILYPESFVERCRDLAELGVEIEVLGEAEMAKLGMGALLGVGQGSARESQMLIMQWHGAPKARGGPLAFIGKGVCFDTGGISIKPAGGMEEMKWDMGGAGVVAGLMHALAARKAAVNVVGICGLVENMPSSTAQRPGDVVTSMSGQTIEVINTDAEGRLVLCDALWYCQDRFKPRFMIDLATLTGAILVSLAKEHAGLFSDNDELAERLAASGAATGDTVWRMPMGETFDRMIDSDIADMKNVGGRFGGSITAAQFLRRFTGDVPWAHLDIAGVTWQNKDLPTAPKGASGWGVRLLDHLVATYYEK